MKHRQQVKGHAWSVFLLGSSLLSATCGNGEVQVPEGEFTGGPQRVLSVGGERKVLVGHSVTQAPLQNPNFDLTGWLETLEESGINAAMVWSFMAVRQNQESGDADRRFGYLVPDIGPWTRHGSDLASDRRPVWDLTRFDEELYWPRFRELLVQTESRGLVLWITLFDGWAKEFAPPFYHPFHVDNGGPLKEPSDFVELFDFDAEIDGPFDPSWPWQKKNQWIQEQFAARVAREIDPYDHVILELFNEGSWYGSERLVRHHRHFLEFMRRRTDNLLAVNEDYIRLGPERRARSELTYDIASWHSQSYDHSRVFSRWLRGHFREPKLPLVNSETVPAFTGRIGGPTLRDVRTLLWVTLLAGSHVFVQDDAAFSFDPNAPQRLNRDLLEQLGFAAQFFGRDGIDPADFVPCPRRSDPAFCLSVGGGRSILYSPGGGPVTFDPEGVGDHEVNWFNPRSGDWGPKENILSQGAPLVLRPPGSGDWVVEIQGH